MKNKFCDQLEDEIVQNEYEQMQKQAKTERASQINETVRKYHENPTENPYVI